MKLIIASNNKGKIREYKQLLEPFGYEVVSQSEAGININVEETGKTFAENSALKARAIFELAKCAVIADDSGLVVDALNGEPGVYSARYGGCTNDADRVALILEKLKDVKDEDRTAYFVCNIHFIKENGEQIAVEGRVCGKIGYEPLGDNGFGYDPIFMYEGKSFSQISAVYKNTVSHRANAFKKLIEQLKSKEVE